MLALVCKRMEAPQQSALLQTIKGKCLKTCTTRATQTGVSLPGNIYLEQLPASQDQLPAPYRAHLATLAIVPVPPGVSVDAILAGCTRNAFEIPQSAAGVATGNAWARISCHGIYGNAAATAHDTNGCL